MKPILFNTEMVKAILDGRKTVTRRLVKPRYRDWDNEIGFQIVTDANTGKFIRVEIVDDWDSCTRILPPPYQPGDILYVRETWQQYRVRKPLRAVPDDFKEIQYLYRADGEVANSDGSPFVWRPSIHMPKEAARIFLRVTHVRVERLQAITADECPMEGVWPLFAGLVGEREGYYKAAFAKLWDSTIKPTDLDAYGWGANPWVWVIKFEKISKEEAMKC